MERRPLASFRHAAALVVLVALPAPAAAQLQEVRSGDYELRSNVVGSLFLPPIVAREHGIVPSRERGLLNVVMARAGTSPLQSVPARVTARIERPGDTRAMPIAMREVAANGGVSYIGTFEFPPGQTVDV